MRQIRGDITFVDLADRTGVSRQTLMAIEDGTSTKLSTLRQIAKCCKLTDDQWDGLVVAWVACELGPEDFGRLNRRLSPKLEGKGDEEQLMRTIFKRLSENERRVVLASAMIPSVRVMMPGLLKLYHAGKRTGGIDVEHGITDEYLKLAKKYLEEGKGREKL